MSHIYKRLSAGTSAALFCLALLSTFIIINPAPAGAIDCNGTASSEDCLHTTVASFTGDYRTILAGDGMFEDNSSGSLSLNIPNCADTSPATIFRATLSWAIRDSIAGYWEDGVDLDRDAGTASSITHDRRYKSQPQAGLYYSTYSTDITSTGVIQGGSHTYNLANMDTSGTADFITTQWGFGLHVVYECPEFEEVEITQKDGMDMHWRGWSGVPWAANRSELICETFLPSASARTATLGMFLPGAATANRQADIWYKTGTGTTPSATAYDLLSDVNTAANGGIVLARAVIGVDPEWDSYQNTTMVIPAGDTYACAQVDSSFNTTEHPDNAAYAGASMFSGGAWFAISTPPPPVTTLSLGNLVWEDVNNNGIVDGAEAGICNVDVDLYLDLGGDGKYDSSVEGTSPLASVTTGCGGSAGSYLFTGLSPGDYLVVIAEDQFGGGAALENYVTSTGTIGSPTGPSESPADPDNDVNNSDDGENREGGVAACAVTLTVGGEPTNDGDTDNDTNLTVDFGFFQQAKLGNYVWEDDNKNGIQDSGESGVENVTVTLHSTDDDSVIATTTTTSDGGYQFCYLIPGDYYVVFSDLPEDYSFTDTGEGTDADDSNADESTGQTISYSLSAGEVIDTVDGGIVLSTATTVDGDEDEPETTELAVTGITAGNVSAVGGLLAVTAAFYVLKNPSILYKSKRRA